MSTRTPPSAYPRPRERALPPGATEPLPPLLLAALDATAEYAAWAESVERCTDLQESIRAATAAVERAEAADEAADRATVREGKPPGKPRLPKAEADLEQARRRRDVAVELVNEAIRDLREAGRAFAADAGAAAEVRVEAELDTTAAALGEADRAILAAREAGAEAQWLAVYGEGGSPTWTPGGRARLAVETTGAVRAALDYLRQERAEREAAAAQLERERAAAEEEARLAAGEATYIEEPER